MAMLAAPPPSATFGSPAIAFSCRARRIPPAGRGLDGSKAKAEAKARASAARRGAAACRASADGGSSAVSDAGFPGDYDELLVQAKAAAELALRDKKQLVEIEFPTAGLESVPGDGEGGIEMTGSMQLIREFCDGFIVGEKARRTRIFFPEAKEVDFARKSVFEGSSLNLDYLTKPSFFEDFGFTTKVKMSDRVKPDDEVFLVAYPYFNVNGTPPQKIIPFQGNSPPYILKVLLALEMLVVEELYREAVVNTERKLIIFNGELDRIRTGCILLLGFFSSSPVNGCSWLILLKPKKNHGNGETLTSQDYPAFFYPKLGALAKNFLPKMETAYYIHNFKGRKGGVLFRSYPGPWKVLRKVNGKYYCLHQQEEMPSLKEVALDILPSV